MSWTSADIEGAKWQEAATFMLKSARGNYYIHPVAATHRRQRTASRHGWSQKHSVRIHVYVQVHVQVHCI